MDNNDFGNIDISIKKKHQNSFSSKIHYFSQNSGKNKHILFLVESVAFREEQLHSVSTWLKREFPPTQWDFDIVSASFLKYDHNKIQKEGVGSFYEDSRSDFKKFIREGVTQIISSGYALTGITLNSDVTVSAFYDVIFNKSWFYSPYTDTSVYPIDSMDQLFKKDNGSYLLKDCSRVEFARHQLHQVKINFGRENNTLNDSRLRMNVISSHEEWKAFYERFKSPEYKTIAWDTETSSLDYNKAQIGDLTTSFDGISGYYIPWKYVNIVKFGLLISNKQQWFANGKYDAKVTENKGLKNVKVTHDVVSLGQSINEMRSNKLKSLAYYYTKHGGYDIDLNTYVKEHKITNYLNIPDHIRRKYATMDAIITYQVCEAMISQIKALDKKYPAPSYGNTIGWTLERYYTDIRIPAINTFTKIEQRGIVVNLKKWDINSNIIQGKISAVKKELSSAFNMKQSYSITSSFSDDLDDDMFDYADTEVEDGDDLKSGMKLGKILEAKGWECLGRTKAKFYLTGEEQLTRWEQLGHKEASLIKNLRSYLTMQKTFLGRVGTQEGWRQYITYHKEDNTHRVHPSYGVMATETGRNSCSKPNWQQIPSSALDAYLFKEIFDTPNNDEWVILTLDYKAFQVRLAALDVGDKRDYLFNEYIKNNDLDLHSKTAYNVFCKGELYNFVELNGVEYFEDQEVPIIRDNVSIKVKAKDVIMTDEMVAY